MDALGAQARVVEGVDLAGDPSNTAVAVLTAGPGGAAVEIVTPPVTDDDLVAVGGRADVVGVDAPLGWPDPFVDAVACHHRGQPWPMADDPVAQRRLLSKRATDRFVRALTGTDPLSVSADRIGAVAMRAARLQTLWAGIWGAAADRAGSGRVVEVYPAAALRQWGLAHRAYKGRDRAEARAALVDSVVAGAPWLDGAGPACRSSDHCLDALVSALVALAASLGLTERPAPGEEAAAASREGWIHVPTCSLADLLAVATRRAGSPGPR